MRPNHFIVRQIVEFNQYCKFKLKLIGKNNQLEIISIYRPPKSGNDARLCEIIDAAFDKFIVVGDFNFPGIDWLNKKVNGKGNGFMQTCEDNQLDQLVDFPTHVRCNTLDLVLSNTDNVTCVEDIGRLGKSDHSMLLIDTEFNAAVKETTQLTPNWRKANVADIKHEIASVDWQTALAALNAQDAWQFFKETVDKITSAHVPMSMFTLQHY